MFDPIPGIQIVFRRPAAESETLKQWLERFQEEAAARKPVPKWIRDHFDSVDEFNAWKAEHPRDGTLTVMRRHAPAIVASVALLTGNFMLGVVALGMDMEKRRAKNRRI